MKTTVSLLTNGGYPYRISTQAQVSRTHDKLVLRHSVRLTILGLALGLAGAWGATRILGSFLVDVNPSDPATFAATTLLLASTAVVACWLPARRAARVDPVVALRNE